MLSGLFSVSYTPVLCSTNLQVVSSPLPLLYMYAARRPTINKPFSCHGNQLGYRDQQLGFGVVSMPTTSHTAEGALGYLIINHV